LHAEGTVIDTRILQIILIYYVRQNTDQQWFYWCYLASYIVENFKQQ